MVIGKDGAVRELPSKFLMTIKHDEVYRIHIAGGGGYGDPFTRDPALVLRDVVLGKVSVDHAREAYGVVVRGTPPEVDEEATRALRARSTAH
jgi:N-methylhydantoinase B